MMNYLKLLHEMSENVNIKGEDKIVIKNFFMRLKDYWYIYDMDNGTIHVRIFEALYLCKIQISHNQIAEKLHVGERTLDRYIVKYNDLAIKLLKSDYEGKFVLLKKSSKNEK